MPSVFESKPSLKKPVAIYLAGGMRSNWQDAVMACLPKGVIWLDPRKSGSTVAEEYTAWDLRAVEMADVVLGYMERTNPNGAGLAMEFGYACRCDDKHLIYVEDDGFPFARYFGMVKSVAKTYADMRYALESLSVRYALPLDLKAWEAFAADRFEPA